MPSVLVGVDESRRRRLRAILAGCRLTFVQTRRQFRDCLAAEPFSLALLGSRFDAGQAFGALQDAVDAGTACPVLCLATGGTGTPDKPWKYTEFRSVCLELGAYDTLDLTRWTDDEHGNACVRALLDSVLRSEPAKHARASPQR
jgi:hypothetical protein